MKKISFWMCIPIAFLIVVIIGIITVYVIARQEQRVCSLVSTQENCTLKTPFISVTAEYPPGSYIFAETMCLAAFLVLVTAVLRFTILQTMTKNQFKILNTITLALLCLVCVGMTILGNVQLSVNSLLHNIGAYAAFGVGLIACWTNSVLTFHANIQMEGRIIGIFRTFLSFTATIAFILYMVLQGMASAKAQWALVILVSVYIASLAIELRFSNFRIHFWDTRNSSGNTNKAGAQVILAANLVS
ncbi:transmembrane protein 150C [Callorhinchus milii]|uniref:transmembrane protein 150C n=1 Tax=Callorhinchus milii TaxID=7868 RepID=UPI001C3F6A1F|nr:transmembrane protein 150C [Callorhinchus milii]